MRLTGAKGLSIRLGCLAALSLLLPSCSKYLDGIVFNPCAQSAKVSFSDASSPPTRASGWHDQVIVPPITARRIANIFADLGKTQISFAQVQIGDRPSQILEVKVTGEEPVPVLIPAANCPTDGPLPVQYTVDLLPIGTEGHARVRYREPDGTMITKRVILPWRSDILVFRTGDLLVLEAKTLDHLDHGEIALLQCEALIDPGNPEGKAAGSSRANMCDVRTRARTSGGFSFPD
jgi:hypothetical protein